jgi:hypothetical protein
MTRNIFILLLALFIGVNSAEAQFRGRLQEIGVIMGASQFLGELGGNSKIGRPFIADMELTLTRPALGGFYRYNLNHYVSVRGSLIWGIVQGNDKLANPRNLLADEWFRYYRNLSFRSGVVEFSTQLEVNFLRYEPRRKRFRFAPYAFIGIGGFVFNPKGKINPDPQDPNSKEKWVRLQPLGTEGQGTPEYPGSPKYSLLAYSVPMGFGFKYAVNRYWNLGFEIGHRPTNEDYIDDVSTTFPGEDVFFDNYEPEIAQLAYRLSRRSLEYDSGYGWAARSTKQYQQRGDPSSFDHYTFVGTIVVIFNITGGRVICPKF